jgi:leader peptidase (prepilin peptidase) / N-methyltransferase
VTAVVVAYLGILGLAVGSFLNVVAYRVPAGETLLRESRCPACDAPIRWWQNVPVMSWLALRGRCASCRSGIPVRYPLVELATGVAFALVALWWLHEPGAAVTPLPARIATLAAYLWFAASGVVLIVIDLAIRRLPHAITGSALGVCAALLTAACLLGADWQALLRAGAGAAALFAFYWLLRTIRPDGMGGGDVRLASVCGLMLGWIGWMPLIVGAFAAFVFGGVFGIALMVRGAGRRSAIAFGPWIVAGAWVGVVAGDALGSTYLAMAGVS